MGVNPKRKVRQDLKTENIVREHLKTQKEVYKMAKIDVTKIEGYDAMTPEEKLAVLEGFEYEDNATELERYKSAVTKANSEAAEWKKKHNALLSDEEQKKATRDEEINTLRSELDELKKEKLVSGYKTSYLTMGYDETLAEASATALAEGNMEAVFANQKKFLETQKKAIKKEILGDTPTPPAGEGGDTMTLEKLQKMTVSERYEYSTSHPEEYKKLYGGNVNG